MVLAAKLIVLLVVWAIVDDGLSVGDREADAAVKEGETAPESPAAKATDKPADKSPEKPAHKAADKAAAKPDAKAAGPAADKGEKVAAAKPVAKVESKP